MKTAIGLTLGFALMSPAKALPQTQEDTSSGNEPPPERIVIDILAPAPGEVDSLLTEECKREQDAARIRGEIVVCRDLFDGEGAPGFDKDEWERRYAERTQGTKAPDVHGAGGSIIMPGEGSLVTVTVTQKVGKAPPPALIIDIEELPEAPPGSDAERVARGLPPLEDD